jgi:uncharacterized membrane protein
VTDTRMELIIGNLLRAGVVLAAFVVAAGGVWYLAASGTTIVGYHHFSDTKPGLAWLSGGLNPQSVIFIGLLILIATPVARVIFSMIAFALERDHLYVAVTFAVLAVLLYSIGTAVF